LSSLTLTPAIFSEIKDFVNVNSLPVKLLATFGSIDVDSAKCCYCYAHEKLIKPLGLFDKVTVLNKPKKGPCVTEDQGDCREGNKTKANFCPIAIQISLSKHI
jgi:hypothetical protein